MLLPRGGVRGDRSRYGVHRVFPVCTARIDANLAGMLTVKGTLVLRTMLPFAGGCWNEGLRPVLLRCEGPPNLVLDTPVTKGARESLRRGIRATTQGARVLHSVFRPTEPGPPVAGVARRRRGGWRGYTGVAKPLRGKAALGWLL
jgi:hypothetical protein